MKISRQKINKMIKESIRSVLFESRFESMSAEELLAVDFESLSPEEKKDYEIAFDNASDTVVDDFDDEEDNKGLETSRRGFLKGLAGAAALGGVGKFALDQIKTKTASMDIFSESPLDLSSEIDMMIYTKGIRELKQRGSPTFFHPKEIVDEIFSGITQCSTRELIQIAIPKIAKKLSSDLQSKSRGLTDEGKTALAQMYYEYYNSVADYLGIFFSEMLFQMLYYHYDDPQYPIPFMPLSLVKTYGAKGGYEYLISEEHMDRFNFAQGEHGKLLEGGLLDKQFVRVNDGTFTTSRGVNVDIVLEIFKERVHGKALYKVYESIQNSNIDYQRYQKLIWQSFDIDNEMYSKIDTGELTRDEYNAWYETHYEERMKLHNKKKSSMVIGNDYTEDPVDFFGSYISRSGEGLKDTTGEEVK